MVHFNATKYSIDHSQNEGLDGAYSLKEFPWIVSNENLENATLISFILLYSIVLQKSNDLRVRKWKKSAQNIAACAFSSRISLLKSHIFAEYGHVV